MDAGQKKQGFALLLRSSHDDIKDVLLQGESRGVASTDAIRQAKSQQQGGTVPVIAVVPQEGLASEQEAASVAAADADGIAVPLDRLQQTAASFSGRTDREAQNPVSSPMADSCQ